MDSGRDKCRTLTATQGEELVEEVAPQEQAGGGEEPSVKKATREVADGE